jgi:hypothetical protein
MGLKQIKDSDRIVFFNLFTKEILLSFFEKERAKLNIEAEKIRQKLVEEKPVQIEFKRIIKNPAPKKITAEPMQISRYSANPAEKEDTGKIPAEYKISMSSKMETPVQPYASSAIPKTAIVQEKPHINGYKRIELFLRDPSILSIECPGTGKNILVRRFKEINMTRLSLSQTEIMEVIEEFSKQARIPLTGGILKAAVGNSVISAVVSEFVGPRFIINKITPYSLIYKK